MLIGYLKGTVKLVSENAVILDTGNIGFKVFIPSSVRTPNTGEPLELYTFLNVAEGILDLYGFATAEQLNTFEMLKSVSGVGPKAALAILSTMQPAAFALAVVTNDVKAITAAKGVGPKLAQKIILELKDKMKNDDLGIAYQDSLDDSATSLAPNEAVSALMVLGYSLSEAAGAVKGLDSSLSTEDAIKAALKKLM